MSRVYEYTVVSHTYTTPSTFVVILYRKHAKHQMSFKPGQYAVISFMGRNNRPTPARCFSIASSPLEEGYLRFGIRMSGNYTKTAAAMLVPGARVVVEGPYGSFIFDAKHDISTMLIAGGIGVAPFMGMLRYATELDLTNNIALVYSCRSQDDIAFLEELLWLKKLNPRFGIVFIIDSGPVDRLQGEYVIKGRVDGDLLDHIVSKRYEGRKYFICGPPGFMKGVGTTLRDKGVVPDQVVTEAFGQGQVSHHSLGHNVPIQVYTLTGLSMVLATSSVAASTLVKVLSAAPQAGNVATSKATNTTSASSNSRQATVDRLLANLQNLNSTQAPSSTTNVAPTAPSPTPNPTPVPPTTPAPVPSPAPSPTPSPTPTLTPPPGPSPIPAPTPTPSPVPSPSPTPTPAPTPSPTPNPTPTPLPPPPPPAVAPTLNFSASSTYIIKGQSSTLSWSTNSDATQPVSCAASGGWSGTKASSGSQSVKPSSNTTYKLQCSNSVGNTATSSITITVCTSSPSQC